MNLGLPVVRHLAERIFHIGISIEHGTLITRDQFLLCCLREVFLSKQLVAVEDRPPILEPTQRATIVHGLEYMRLSQVITSMPSEA